MMSYALPIIGRYLYKVPSPNGPTGPGISSKGFTLFNLLSVQKHRTIFRSDEDMFEQVFFYLKSKQFLERLQTLL